MIKIAAGRHWKRWEKSLQRKWQFRKENWTFRPLFCKEKTIFWKEKNIFFFLKDVLLKGKEDLLDEKARNQKLAAKVIEGKEAAISGLKMELLRAKELLSARGIFERKSAAYSWRNTEFKGQIQCHGGLRKHCHA
jgi:hypothetical protein